MAEIAPLRAGDPAHLGPYRLTGLLGEGGQGAVYLGEDEPGHHVAVKLLHARFSGDPKARSRFAAEVAVAKRVSPFCTARVLDSDVEGDRPYIVSEYIDGPSLSAVLAAEGPRRGADLDRVAIGTMTALAAIHHAGVVHRDFKPANVLLAPDGPRVIDFGIARALDATGTLSSTAIGTPAYMAPEQISGAPVGPAADVWAWGATMVYAATVRPAFGQDSIPAVMHRILNLPPDLGALTEPLRGLVASCLSKDPLLRPASQQVLAHLLRLAGSLPAAGGAGEPEDAEMLTQGAEAAADPGRTGARPHALAPPPYVPQAFPQPPAAMPVPGPPPAGHTPAGPLASAPPLTPWAQRAEGPGWPAGHATAPVVELTETPPSRRRGKRGRRVLAGVGGSALAVLIVVGTVVAVRATRHDPDPPTGRVGGTLRMTSAEVTSPGGEIDPSHSLTGTGHFLAKQLFTGLTELGADGVARNRLAIGITPDTTCENWHITLREGTRFSNGDPVDAAAFARGWARSAASPDGSGPLLLSDVKGYPDVATGKAAELSGVKTSGSALDVALTSPHCEFATRLSDPVFAPVPVTAGKADNKVYNLAPVGNGPFRLQQYVKDKSAMLVRNETWAFGRTKLDSVTVQLGSDTAQGRASFTAGGTDWAHLGPGDLATAPKNSLVTGSTPFTRMLVPITARGPMRTKEARLAVSYALDRGKISTALGGVQPPARGVVPMALPGFGRTGQCPSCDVPDPVKAKELAGRAGLPPGTTVRLYLQDTVSGQRLAPLVQAQLESVLGWKIEVRHSPLSDFTGFRKSLVAGDASGLALFSWGPDYPDPYTMLWPLLGSTLVATDKNQYYNLSGWRNTRFDTLISSALRNTSADARTRYYKEAEKVALDDMALIPLVFDGRAVLVSDRYVDLKIDYDGDPTLATAALK
ncbi:ABC transporter substrate-binding protein [Actinomadura roseirufa]|uniref:ABC transporter substrate-binding protein n=1 Tax=Actinomadura roseirufa TaxID=2094049 RepID=UPI0010410694|nr:ABC transporter substrate-binding protein [Actinomadura roseirufa]